MLVSEEGSQGWMEGAWRNHQQSVRGATGLVGPRSGLAGERGDELGQQQREQRAADEFFHIVLKESRLGSLARCGVNLKTEIQIPETRKQPEIRVPK